MNNLQAELEVILSMLLNFRDPWEWLDESKQAILTTVSKHLPKKYVTDGSTWQISPDYHRGHNAAITEMEKTFGGSV